MQWMWQRTGTYWLRILIGRPLDLCCLLNVRNSSRTKIEGKKWKMINFLSKYSNFNYNLIYRRQKHWGQCCFYAISHKSCSFFSWTIILAMEKYRFLFNTSWTFPKTSQIDFNKMWNESRKVRINFPKYVCMHDIGAQFFLNCGDVRQ